MITSVADERITGVRTTDEQLVVSLADGRTLATPLDWYPRLLSASPEQRNDWLLLGGGYAVHWPQIDEDLSVQGFLRGVPAPGARLQHSPVGETRGVGSASQGEVPPEVLAAVNAVVGEVPNQEILQSSVRVFQQFQRESADIYAGFLNSALSIYQQALEQALQQATQSGLQAAGQAAQSNMQVAQQVVQAAAQAAQQTTESATQTAQQVAESASQAARGTASNR